MANVPSTESVRTPPHDGARSKNIGLWVLQATLAAMFAMSGVFKLTGASAMVALFDAVGIGQWFRYATGGLEVLGVGLILIPSLAGVGAAILAMVMAVAVLTHLFVIGGSPALPLVLLAGAIVVAWGRWKRTMALQRRGIAP